MTDVAYFAVALVPNAVQAASAAVGAAPKAELPALYALMLFMLIAALIAVETRDLLSSVLCLGAVGLALAVIDLVLKAPDLALTQAVVEIFAVVLLIRLVVTREDTTKASVRDTMHVALVGGLLVVLVLISWQCLGGLRPFGEPLMHMGREYLELDVGARHAVPLLGTGAANKVTAVLLDFRAYDTLGEATVIFAGVVGCYVLLRRKGKSTSLHLSASTHVRALQTDGLQAEAPTGEGGGET